MDPTQSIGHCAGGQLGQQGLELGAEEPRAQGQGGEGLRSCHQGGAEGQGLVDGQLAAGESKLFIGEDEIKILPGGWSA